MNMNQKDLDKMIQICFEKFQISKLSFYYSPVLSLMAEGLETGYVISSGEEITQRSLIINNRVIQEKSDFVCFGGKSLREEMIKEIKQ